MEDRRISNDMFIQDVEGLDKKSKQSKVTKNKLTDNYNRRRGHIL